MRRPGEEVGEEEGRTGKRGKRQRTLGGKGARRCVGGEGQWGGVRRGTGGMVWKLRGCSRRLEFRRGRERGGYGVCRGVWVGPPRGVG